MVRTIFGLLLCVGSFFLCVLAIVYFFYVDISFFSGLLLLVLLPVSVYVAYNSGAGIRKYYFEV